MYDLHLHSTHSDGDFTVAELIAEAARRGLKGMSLTDHNGIWGIDEAVVAAKASGLEFLPGIEITALSAAGDVHVLGYSRAFTANVLREGLADTRAGYWERTSAMVKRCHEAGFSEVSLEAIKAARSGQVDPCFVSYDVSKQLMQKYKLSFEDTRLLTTRGGVCYVPYGDWALTPAQAVALIHQANGIAVLAHPGTIAFEGGEAALDVVISELTSAGLDGIEIYHPFHAEELIVKLKRIVSERKLLTTGGSDWHGPGRFHDAHFGTTATTKEQLDALMARLG